MHSSWIRSIVLPALIAVVSIACEAAETGVHSVDAAWTSAMKANDLDAVMKTYAPDAIAWLPQVKEARGEKAIRAAYEGLLSANKVTQVSVSETGHRTVGKSSIGWGHFSLTLAPKAGGNPVVLAGRYTVVAERRGGRWMYVVDHASAEPTEPAKQ